MSEPAIAVIELDSIAMGIKCGDAMVKAAPVSSIFSGSIQPGKYVILVGGDTASVEVAVETAAATAVSSIIDSVFLPDVHSQVIMRLTGEMHPEEFSGEALSILETTSVSRIIDAADAGVKAADVELSALVLGDGLGGRGYLLFSGSVAEVAAAQDAAAARAGEDAYRQEIISQLHPDMAANLLSELRFNARVVIPEDS